jgi:hypothetical protein
MIGTIRKILFTSLAAAVVVEMVTLMTEAAQVAVVAVAVTRVNQIFN